MYMRLYRSDLKLTEICFSGVLHRDDLVVELFKFCFEVLVALIDILRADAGGHVLKLLQCVTMAVYSVLDETITWAALCL